MLKGIDVSHYQGLVKWDLVMKSGVSFAFLKATNGLAVDPMFQENLKGARAAGLVVGAYHFFKPLSDPAEQAKNFLSQFDPKSPILPALDLEWVKPNSPDDDYKQMTQQQKSEAAQAFLDVVQEAMRRIPVVYTCAPFANEHLVAFPGGYYPLWLARYAPTVPAGWKNWVFWQNTESGSCPGVHGPVDGDVCNLDLDGLKAMAGC